MLPLLKLLPDLHGNQLRATAGVLDGIDRVFCCEFPHEECELAVGGHYDGSAIKPPHVLLAAATVNFHHEFDVCQLYFSSEESS